MEQPTPTPPEQHAGDPVGAARAAHLAMLGELIDSIAGTERMIAAIQAFRARLVDEARGVSELLREPQSRRTPGGWTSEVIARRSFTSDLAATLRIPERTAETLVAQSQMLVHSLPETLDALRDGDISYRHAQRIVDHAASIPDEARSAFEQAILPAAKKLPVARLDRKARDVRERVHPETIRARHERSVADRSVSVDPARDGMAWLTAYLPAPTAYAIQDRLTTMSRSLKLEGETRTNAQLQADALTDLLLDGEVTTATATPLGRGVRARVNVTVPVLTLMGLSEEPATLEGYGPIDPQTARELAAHAPSFRRILTHPETGVVLSVGRDSYAVPADLRAWLQARDETCRSPGCGRPAARCDLDHIVDWQYGGETNHDNLAHECEGHHDLKHHTGWTVKSLGDGVLEWTSPTGHVHTTEPAMYIPAVHVPVAPTPVAPHPAARPLP